MNHAVIMAAGRGIRMMPLTHGIPKAMAPFRGTTLIAQGIERLRAEIAHIHVTVGYRGAMLAEHVITHGADTVLNTEGRGNCWWLYNTFLGLIDEPICVLTCDNVVELDLGMLEAEYEAHDRPACMLVPVEPVPGLEGDYIFHEDHVVTHVDRHRPASIYCSGIQLANPARIRALTNEVEDWNGLWEQLIALRELRVSRVYPKRWFTADTVAQLEALGKMDRRAASD